MELRKGVSKEAEKKGREASEIQEKIPEQGEGAGGAECIGHRRTGAASASACNTNDLGLEGQEGPAG